MQRAACTIVHVGKKGGVAKKRRLEAFRVRAQRKKKKIKKKKKNNIGFFGNHIVLWGGGETGGGN